MPKKPEPGPADGVVWKGPDALRPLLIRLDLLHEDPANVNEHTEEGIARLAAGLARYGQQHTVMCDSDLVVRAGNGRLRAARNLGWTHMAVVPSDLRGFDLSTFAAADNQLGRLSQSNLEKLLELLEAARSEQDFQAEAMGFSEAEIDKMFEDAAKAAAGVGDDGQDAARSQEREWAVLVTCRDGSHQIELIDRLTGEGLTCQPLTS